MRLSVSWSNDEGGYWRVISSVIVLVSIVLAGTVAGGMMTADGAVGSHAPTDTQADDDGALVEIESQSNETAHYRLIVNGTIEPANESNEMDEQGSVGDGVANGTVNASDTDAFRATGSIEGVVLAGNVSLLLDGQAVTPTNLSDGWAVTFTNCSTVEVAGDFETGYGFSTVIFPVRTSNGTFLGFEEATVNERLTVENQTATLQAGTTLPENVSNVTALRSVFLYEQQIVGTVDPLLVESEVMVTVGQPAVRVENPAHNECQREIMDRLENEVDENATTISGAMTGT